LGTQLFEIGGVVFGYGLRRNWSAKMIKPGLTPSIVSEIIEP